MTEPKTWGDLVNRIRQACDDGDWEDAEETLQRMQRESAHHGDLGLEASALFYEGILADRQGQLERAEGCFQHLVDVDRRHHGPVHEAVADALNSLAIVRTRLGRHDAAADARVDEAAILVELASPRRVSALVSAGEALLRAKRMQKAQATFRDALEHPAPREVPWHKHACLRIEELLRRERDHQASLVIVARGLAIPIGRTPQHREAHARLLVALGHLSWVFGLEAQCHAAHRAALAYTEAAPLREEARRAMDACPAEPRIEGSLDAYRVVAVFPDDLAHVLHASEGSFMTRHVVAPVLGEVFARDEDTDRFRRP